MPARMSEGDFARLIGGRDTTPAKADSSPSTGLRDPLAWVHAIAVLMVLGGLLSRNYHIMGIGLVWSLAMVMRELREIKRKLEE